ncbi:MULTISPECIES: thermonuclease family protein [unclassified Variovorax]
MIRLIACLLFALPFFAQAQPRLCLVVGVSDGDTLSARCGAPGAYEQVKVRVAAIDAPESRQPFGQRSKQALSGLCYMEQARISPRDTDRYGRTVADVKCRGEDAGRHQVAGGWAWVYERYASRDDGALFKMQYTARAQRLGLWADAKPVAPWDWRKAQHGG